jgi:hypothetical protein
MDEGLTLSHHETVIDKADLEDFLDIRARYNAIAHILDFIIRYGTFNVWHLDIRMRGGRHITGMYLEQEEAEAVLAEYVDTRWHDELSDEEMPGEYNDYEIYFDKMQGTESYRLDSFPVQLGEL